MDHLLLPAGREAARPAADVRGAPRASPSVARRARSFLSRIAAERGTTYVLMGTPWPRNALRRLTSPALPFRLLRLLPGVDLRIVADRSRRNTDDRP